MLPQKLVRLHRFVVGKSTVVGPDVHDICVDLHMGEFNPKHRPTIPSKEEERGGEIGKEGGGASFTK